MYHVEATIFYRSLDLLRVKQGSAWDHVRTPAFTKDPQTAGSQLTPEDSFSWLEMWGKCKCLQLQRDFKKNKYW